MLTRQLIPTPDGRQLDVHVAGAADGTALFFHCGTPGSSVPYPGMLDALERHGMRYVSASRPGYGASTRRPGRVVADVVDDVATVLDSLGIESCYMVGWSGGGPHALACAARMPDRVRKGALIASVAPWRAAGLDFLDGMAQENVDEFRIACEGGAALEAFMSGAWPAYRSVTGAQVADALGGLASAVDRAALTGDLADWCARCIREGLAEGYWGWFDDDVAFTRDWGFDPGSITVPVHVWQGRHDNMVPFAHGQWLAANVGAAMSHLSEEHGHLSLVANIGDIVDTMVAGAR